jgi:hypothetical protein
LWGTRGNVGVRIKRGIYHGQTAAVTAVTTNATRATSATITTRSLGTTTAATFVTTRASGSACTTLTTFATDAARATGVLNGHITDNSAYVQRRVLAATAWCPIFANITGFAICTSATIASITTAATAIPAATGTC